MIPPYTNTRAIIGKLDTTSRNIFTKAAPSIPATISQDFMPVVSIRSRVCRSLSPLMDPAVVAGMMSSSMINSMPATKRYRSRKLLYWMSAVRRTCSTLEYIFRRATMARMLLNTVMIRGILRLLAMTIISLL